MYQPNERLQLPDRPQPRDFRFTVTTGDRGKLQPLDLLDSANTENETEHLNFTLPTRLITRFTKSYSTLELVWLNVSIVGTK